MSPLRKLARFRQSLQRHTDASVSRYAAMMTQVEALRVEVSALEVEIRRTERSNLPPAHKNARIRGLASRASESYGQMLCLLRQAADVYPAILLQPLDIPHSFTRREREEIIHLPERPPSIGRREVVVFVAIGIALALAAMLLSRIFPVTGPLPLPTPQ